MQRSTYPTALVLAVVLAWPVEAAAQGERPNSAGRDSVVRLAQGELEQAKASHARTLADLVAERRSVRSGAPGSTGIEVAEIKTEVAALAVQLAALRLAEVEISGRPAIDALTGASLGARDFVAERLEVSLAMARRSAELHDARAVEYAKHGSAASGNTERWILEARGDAAEQRANSELLRLAATVRGAIVRRQESGESLDVAQPDSLLALVARAQSLVHGAGVSLSLSHAKYMVGSGSPQQFTSAVAGVLEVAADIEQMRDRLRSRNGS